MKKQTGRGGGKGALPDLWPASFLGSWGGGFIIGVLFKERRNSSSKRGGGAGDSRNRNGEVISTTE